MQKAKPERTIHRLTYEKRKSLFGFLFATPWLIGCIYFLIIPVIQSIIYSFSQYTNERYEIIGFKNYLFAFTEDPNFIKYISNSIRNMFLQIPVVLLFSLFVAIILNQKFVGRTIVRCLFFLPVIIANGIIISIISQDVFSNTMMQSSGASQIMKSEFLNKFLLENGVSFQIVQIITQLVNSIFFLIWKSGIQILIFLAGLQTIPTSMYEVAKIEGSTSWEVFWLVTFPMISPIILLNLIYSIIDYFTDYSNTVMVYINSFALALKIEISEAMAWSYFLIILIILMFVYVIVNRWVFYQA